MTVQYAKHDAAGRILFAGEVPESMVGLQGENVWVGAVNVQTDYILDGECVSRPLMPARLSKSVVRADSTDELVIAGVPAGALLRVTGPVPMEGVVERNGDVALTFALAGAYGLALELFPYLDMEEVIHAV